MANILACAPAHARADIADCGVVSRARRVSDLRSCLCADRWRAGRLDRSAFHPHLQDAFFCPGVWLRLSAFDSDVRDRSADRPLLWRPDRAWRAPAGTQMILPGSENG